MQNLKVEVAKVKKTGFLGFVAALLIVFSAPAAALNFTPTESEWGTWGDMCRARFVVSQAGRGSDFARRVAQGNVDMWKANVGRSWYALHHHCAAKLLFQRYKSAFTDIERARLLRRVFYENNYTKERSQENELVFADILILEAQAQEVSGKIDQALAATAKARQLHPKHGPSYSLEAIIRFKQKDLAGAETVLSEALSKEVGGLSEIHYLMALVQRDLGDYEKALAHAEQAETLGYPLTRLKRSLMQKVATASTGSE